MTSRVRPTTGYARPEPPSHLPALITGVLLGAASWAVISNWLAPVFGWPTLIVGMLLLALLCIYLLATAPEGVEA